MKPEETIDHPIRWAWHRLKRRYGEAAAKHGGNMSIGYVLLNIEPQGTPSTKLGPKMGMEPRSLTRTLRKMEVEGLIKREGHDQDRRLALVKLTAKGKQMRDISKQTVIDLNHLLQAHITKEEMQAFRATMAKINGVLDNGDLFTWNNTAKQVGK